MIDFGKVNQPERRIEILTYTSGQVCAALQISKVTLWRLERCGLISPLPHFRHKRYSVDAVRQIVSPALASNRPRIMPSEPDAGNGSTVRINN